MRLNKLLEKKRKNCGNIKIQYYNDLFIDGNYLEFSHFCYIFLGRSKWMVYYRNSYYHESRYLDYEEYK